MSYASQGQAALAALGVGYNFFKKKTGTTPPSSGSTTPSTRSTTAAAAAASSSSKSVAQTDGTEKKSGGGSSSSWWTLQTAAALAAGAGAIGAAGSAYLYREAITNQVGWATSHLSFVGELWKPEELQRRVSKLVAIKEIGFHWSVAEKEIRDGLCQRINFRGDYFYTDDGINVFNSDLLAAFTL